MAGAESKAPPPPAVRVVHGEHGPVAGLKQQSRSWGPGKGFEFEFDVELHFLSIKWEDVVTAGPTLLLLYRRMSTRLTICAVSVWCFTEANHFVPQNPTNPTASALEVVHRIPNGGAASSPSPTGTSTEECHQLHSFER